MKKVEYYFCEDCKENFKTEQEAEKHQEWHKTCICQGGGNPSNTFIRTILGYGISETVCVDFKKSAIVRSYDEDARYSSHTKQIIPINFCPFCGRKLDSQKEIKKRKED